MAPEIMVALVGWAATLIFPRWWLLSILSLVFLSVALWHASRDAGDMIVYALVGAVPAFTLTFVLIGVAIIWSRKAIRRARANPNYPAPPPASRE